MPLDNPVSIEVLSDVNFKDFEWMLIADCTSYDEMKIAVDNNVKNKINKSGSPAKLMILIRFYKITSRIGLEQENGVWTPKFDVFSDKLVNTELAAILNS